MKDLAQEQQQHERKREQVFQWLILIIDEISLENQVLRFEKCLYCKLKELLSDCSIV